MKLKTLDNIRNGQKSLIVCMGDSITEQNYHCHHHLNYVGRLAEHLIQTFGRTSFVFNTGVSGERTDGALRRLHQDALRFKPDLVTLMYGINDSKFGTDTLPEFRSNLEKLIEQVRETDTELLLLTQNDLIYDGTEPANLRVGYSHFVSVIREVADALQVPLCDIYAKWTDKTRADADAASRMMDDALHPNEHGHAFMAQVLLDYMEI